MLLYCGHDANKRNDLLDLILCLSERRHIVLLMIGSSMPLYTFK